MDMELNIILMILLINAIIGLIHSIFLLIQKEFVKSFLMFVFILVCPVFAICFLLISWFDRRIFLGKNIDLNDLSFNRNKREVIAEPDFDKEINIVSIEEALIISDNQDKRRVILDALKENSDKSITMIVNALEDEDSETSHYAASIIADVKADFKVTVQQMSEKLREFPQDEEITILMLEYINTFLEKKLLSEVEEITYISQYEQLMVNLYNHHPVAITGMYYRWLINHLISAKKGNEAITWAERALEQYPMGIDVYKANLKLFYELGDRDKFFEILNRLKSTNMDYDSESTNLIQFYQ